ncbi:Aste57867_3959 [Aphanomyces stellatus]|uniref:Aste57867_3959 protein n=1 Tax=Aphanomyces stellatus TaxID=120398 RepID=A0A485KBM1_9STRA|nr:hypothetical protein As57867_003948 [Aphanomyces stellatus]VFT81096.1 Aste57867_3959 [Aphanomyces stellatus]
MKLSPTGIALLLLTPSLGVFVASHVIFQQSVPVAALLAVLASFVWSDVWYFIDLFLHTVVSALFPLSPSRLQSVMDTHESHAMVSLTDIDRNGHYNNARYLRACGTGRRDFWKANGIWPLIRGAGGNLIVGAQSVRYRRELTLGQWYKLETRIRTWDKQAFYIEHRFVTESAGSSAPPFVHAIVLVKNNVMGPMRPQEFMEAREPGIVAPDMPRDIACWIEANVVSSAMLRPGKHE